jgi:hypothetical protein
MTTDELLTPEMRYELGRIRGFGETHPMTPQKSMEAILETMLGMSRTPLERATIIRTEPKIFIVMSIYMMPEEAPDGMNAWRTSSLMVPDGKPIPPELVDAILAELGYRNTHATCEQRQEKHGPVGVVHFREAIRWR